MKMIKILKIKGHTVKLDMEDWKRIKKYKIAVYEYWNNKYYVSIRIDSKQVYLHRYLLNVTGKHNYIDHINGNTLDNRRSNLRKCDNAQNQWNVDKKANSTHKYKCIRQISKNCYEIRIRSKGKRIYRYAKTLEEAKQKYDVLVKELHGDFAK